MYPPILDVTRELTIQRFADALRKAAEDHHQYELARGSADPDWATWYARHMAQAQGLRLKTETEPSANSPQLTIRESELRPAHGPKPPDNWWERTGCNVDAE